ncbi:unnamed protein product [Caenorhabditis angaria]|uniref:Uncharacterized protein n=1 Tax=Caenorhabditis angaria TaxID=860376 RepID=A0A9P1MXK3_9PELO|nr:unnamed protein product [Caenorhabditis angaria]
MFSTSSSSNSGLYDRLKEYTREIPKDQVACKILLDSLSHVVELEQQLHQLEQKTAHFKMRQFQILQNNPEKVPEDLASVDVSEFKHLVHNSTMNFSRF